MKNKRLNILGIVIIIIFLPLLIINTILIIKSYIKPDQAPSFLGYKPFIVLSGSMEPVIKIGDLVIIKDCSIDLLKEGDIIAFRNGTSVITHRIVEITEENNEKIFITKGDNNSSEDRYPIRYSNVEGLYIYRIPKVGYFAMFLQTTLGAIIFVSIPFILFIITDLAQRKKEKQIQEEKKKIMQKELEELKKE